MQGEVQLEHALGQALLTACPLHLRQEVEEEVEMIISRYAPGRSRAHLLAAAEALRPPADVPPAFRTRLRLWAAALREKARSSGDGPDDLAPGRPDPGPGAAGQAKPDATF